MELLRKDIELLRKELQPQYISPIPEFPTTCTGTKICPICGKLNCNEMHVTFNDRGINIEN